MIYTHFGGKDGLLDALYLHSFAGLTHAFQAESDEQEPSARLNGMVAAYRAFALQEPALYSVMFGDLGRAWEPPLSSRRQAWKSFEAMREAVELCLPQERRKSTGKVTYLLWAAMHGVVSLESRKLLGGANESKSLYHAAVAAVREAHGIA